MLYHLLSSRQIRNPKREERRFGVELRGGENHGSSNGEEKAELCVRPQAD